MADEDTSGMQYDQISASIDRLDDKVSSIQSPRSSPEELANTISSRLSGYFNNLVEYFNSFKQSQDEEQKPRSIQEEVLPIDIVDVSPGAAEQLVRELQESGVGKYDVNINKIDDTDDNQASAFQVILEQVWDTLKGGMVWLGDLFATLLIQVAAFLASAAMWLIARMVMLFGGPGKRGILGRIIGLALILPLIFFS